MQRSSAASHQGIFVLVVLLILASSGLLYAKNNTSGSSGAAKGEMTDTSTSGALFDELEKMDELIFTASFVTCDPQKINGLMTDDIEFYHDLTGFNSGQAVRDNNVNLTKNCPASRGLSRRLVEGSLRVYPIKDYGAIQMGTHIFSEKNSSRGTVAQFVHLWQRQPGKQKAGEKWKISRVLSFDHVDVESATASSLQAMEKKQ